MTVALKNAPYVWADRRFLRCAFWIWVLCTAVYGLTSPGRLDIVDGAGRFEVTNNLLTQGTPTLSNPGLLHVVGPAGQLYSVCHWGTSVAALPFVAIAAWWSGEALSAKQFAFSMTSVPYAAALVSLLFLIYGRLGVPLQRALRWSLVFAFTTLLWPYAGSTFDQAIHAFWLTLAVWAAVEALVQGSLRWAAVAALGFFWLVAGQPAFVVLCVALLPAMRLTLLRSPRALLRTGPPWVIAAGIALGGLSVVVYNYLRFGQVFVPKLIDAGHPVFGNPLIGTAGLLLSPGKSILLYSPSWILGALGLVRAHKKQGVVVEVIAAFLLAHFVLITSLSAWGGEWAWGPRYLVVTLALAAIGVPFFSGEGVQRPVKLAVAGAGLMVQLLAISVEHQVYYFERNYRPYFWLDWSTAYRDSALLARPREFAQVFGALNLDGVVAATPSPNPKLMTECIFGPSQEELRADAAWTRKFLVFRLPRPWSLWSLPLPPSQHALPLPWLFSFLFAALGMAAVGIWQTACKPDPVVRAPTQPTH